MDVFKVYSTDETKENTGVWRDIGDGCSLLIARAGNRAYGKLVTSAVEKNQRALDAKNDAAEALNESIMVEVAAKTVLLGWSGLQYKGADMEYSVENAKILLGIKDFRILVLKLSNEIDVYRSAEEAEVAKN